MLAIALVLVTGCRISQHHPSTSVAASTAAASTACRPPFAIGYRIIPYTGNRSMAIWYPGTSPQSTFFYSASFSSTLAVDGRPDTGCGAFPLVLFSHGLDGCGTQSLFFTETLAREGYVVAAPDYADATLCRVSGPAGGLTTTTEPSIFDPGAWTSSSYVDRKNDLELALTNMLTGSLHSIIDPQAIGLAGHSLGGYTALGVAGGWGSWQDRRIKAVLLFSPYSLPFSIQHTLGNVRVPVMYQGADFDVGITPFLEGPSGAYQQSNAPKYFVKLHGGNHFTWTNLICSKQETVSSCIADNINAELINSYSFAFLNTYLKHQSSQLLTARGTGLAAYLYQQ
jgi:predicted dienelactone hydrolase